MVEIRGRRKASGLSPRSFDPGRTDLGSRYFFGEYQLQEDHEQDHGFDMACESLRLRVLRRLTGIGKLDQESRYPLDRVGPYGSPIDVFEDDPEGNNRREIQSFFWCGYVLGTMGPRVSACESGIDNGPTGERNFVLSFGSKGWGWSGVVWLPSRLSTEHCERPMRALCSEN
jgi:hypothetical protein